jgi:hypothetical protein
MEKVKVTKRDVITATKALIQIGNTPIEDRTAYWLGRNFKKLAKIEKEALDARNDIVKKYGKEDPKTGKWNIAPTIGTGEDEKANPALQKAEDEWNTILDEEIEVEIMKVNVSSFGKVNMNSLVAIDFMVNDPETTMKTTGSDLLDDEYRRRGFTITN